MLFIRRAIKLAVGVTWAGKGGIWPSSMFFLPQKSFFVYCVEERQIKKTGVNKGGGGLYIRDWFKTVLPLILT